MYFANGLTESKQMSFLVLKEVHLSACLFRVFLFHLTSDWVLEAHDKVDLRAHAALVRAKHDRVGSLVSKLGLWAGDKELLPAHSGTVLKGIR